MPAGAIIIVIGSGGGGQRTASNPDSVVELDTLRNDGDTSALCTIAGSETQIFNLAPGASKVSKVTGTLSYT